MVNDGDTFGRFRYAMVIDQVDGVDDLLLPMSMDIDTKVSPLRKFKDVQDCKISDIGFLGRLNVENFFRKNLWKIFCFSHQALAKSGSKVLWFPSTVRPTVQGQGQSVWVDDYFLKADAM